MKNLGQAEENSGMRATNEKNPDKSRSESSFFDNPILNEQKTLGKISELDEKNQEILVRRVFEHSVSDGLKLTAERQYTNRDYLDLISRFSFYIKHQDLAQNLIREAKREVKSDKDRSELEKLGEIYKQYEEDLNLGNYMGHLDKEEREDATTGLKAKESLDEIDNWYSQFLKNKKVKDIYSDDYRSKGEQLGESVINKMKFSLENNYYKGGIYDILIKHISAHSSEDMGEIVKSFFNQNKNLKERYKDGGVDLYLKKIRKGDEDKQIFGDFILEKSLSKKDLEKARTESFFSEDTVKKIVDYFQIDSDLKIKNAIYKPLDITTEMETKMAEKELIKEISENGDEIIWNEQTQKYEIKGSGSEQKETKYLTEEKILDKLEQFIKEGGGKTNIAGGLAGLDSDRAWKMRDQFIKEGGDKDSIAQGLAGLDSDRAWKMRERFIKEGVSKNWIARGLAGLGSDRAWKMREQFIKDGVNKSWISLGLAGLDSDRAWEMRDQFIKEGVDEGDIAEGLAGLDSDRAWKMRDQFIKDGVDKDNIARGLAGLDSDRAWKMREQFIKKGVYKGYIAQGLTGLDSDQAWKMRDQLLKEGADKSWISLGLAGLDSDRAWKMREEFIKEGVGKGYIAQGLAGDYLTFVWQLKKEGGEKMYSEESNRKVKLLNLLNTLSPVEIKIQKDEKDNNNNEKKETKYLTEEKILDKLEQFIKEGGGKTNIAGGLAGLDSDRAWKMRDQFIKEGGDKDSIAGGLAGLDSDRAWKMRERFIKEGVSKNWIARGLAGLGSDRAWKMREQFIKDGVNKSWISLGLAGLDSDRAWEMREQFVKDRTVSKGSIVEGLSGLGSERAWKMRDQFIKEGVDEGDIAEGLAGLDSDRAWKMRDQFIKKGVYKGYIARGLAGDYTTFVWQLKKRDKQEVVINNSLERRDLNKEELRKAILKYLEEDSTLATKNKKEINGHRLASFINTTIKETPELFLKTIVAKKDNRILTTKLVHKSFPSTQIEEKNTWRGFSGYSGFGGSSSFNKEPRPEDYLNPDSREQMMGGNPESGGGREEGKEILRFRESFNDLMILGIYGRLSGINWDPTYQFSIAKQKIVKSKEITVSLPNVGEKVKLPKPIGGNIVLERVKGIIKKEEFPLEMELSPMREGVVRDTKKAEEVVYSIEVDEIPRVMSEVSQNEYEDYKNKFTRNNGKDMLESIGALPEEIDIFLDQIKDKNPKEKVKLIEDFVRSICHYDMKNGEMMGLKVDKDFEERLAIMESRVEELKTKEGNKESFSGKKYAGVCADFAMLSAAILRRAGFASGVLSCLVPTDQKATASDAHATAFVVWPNSSKENEIFSVDGTPNGVEGISAPSIREKEEARDEIVKQIEEKAEEELDEMIQKLDSYSDEEIEALSNGKLENILNIILRYGVSQNNLQVITGLLNSYWYSPLNKLNLDDVEDRVDFLKFFEGEANRSKNEPVKEIEIDAGGKLFETIENFIQRFSKGQKRENGFETIDKIKELFNPVLSEKEKKALSATITYLKAKKMK